MKIDLNSFNNPIVFSKNRDKEPLFEKIVLKANEKLPVDEQGNVIDFRGSVAFTRDANVKGVLHKLINLIQRIHSFIFRREVDTFLSHGILITGRDEREGKEENLLIAHSVFSGIRTGSRNYLQEDDVTELVIYRPRSEALRDYLCRHAAQTCFNTKEKDAEESKGKRMADFSIADMIKSVFHNRQKEPSKATKRRLSYVVADLLLEKQLLRDNLEPRSFFCTPYVITLLQASLIIDALGEEGRTFCQHHGGNRDAIAAEILDRLQNRKQGETLTETFSSNPVLSLNGRFVMSSYAGQALDSVSKQINEP